MTTRAAAAIAACAGDAVLALENVMRERDEARWKLPATHEGPENCPAYYDTCHCNVETLRHNIERAETAEERIEHALHVLRNWVAFGVDVPIASVQALVELLASTSCPTCGEPPPRQGTHECREGGAR